MLCCRPPPLSLSLSLFCVGQNEVEARASVPLRSYAPELLHYVHVPPFFYTTDPASVS